MLNLLLKTAIISIVLIIATGCLGAILLKTDKQPMRYIAGQFLTWFFVRVLISLVLAILSLEMLLQSLKIVS